MLWLNSNFSRAFEFKSENPGREEKLAQLVNFRRLIGFEMFSFLPFKFQPVVKGGLTDLSRLSFSDFRRLAEVDFSGFDEAKRPGLEKMAFSVVVNRFFSSDFPQQFKSNSSTTKDFVFFAREEGWTLVKKARVDSPREDILFALSGSMETLQAKTAQLSTEKWGEFQGVLAGMEPKRTGFSNIAKGVAELKKIDFNSYSKEPYLKEYAYYHVLDKCGFPPFITREEVSMVYPQLKVAKPRGRISKK